MKENAHLIKGGAMTRWMNGPVKEEDTTAEIKWKRFIQTVYKKVYIE